MRVIFSKELIKYTSFQTEVECTGKTVGACLKEVFNKFPQLMVFLLADDGKEANKTSISLNGEYLVDNSSVWTEVSENDIIEFGRDIPEGESGAVRTVAGMVILVVGAIFENPYIMSMGASLMLGGLAEVVMGSPVLPGNTSFGESSTYSFSGIKNTTVSGSPIPIVYGKMRVGGHLLNVYTDVIAKDSYLFAQLGISEGEISGLVSGTVELNGRRQSEFSDIAIYTRRGTKEQIPPAKAETTPEEGINTAILPGVRGLPISSLSSTNYKYTINNNQLLTGMTLKFAINRKNNSWYITGLDSNLRPYIKYYPNVLGPVKIVDSANNVLGSFDVFKSDYSDYNGLRDYTFKVNFPSPISTNIYVVFDYFEIQDGNHNLSVTNFVSYTTINTQLGNTDQSSAMAFFGKIQNTVSLDQLVFVPDTGNPALTVSTSTPVTEVQSLITAPVLYYSDPTKGPVRTKVEFDIFYRKQGDTVWINSKPDSHYYLDDLQKSETSINVSVAFPTCDIYELKYERVTPIHTDLKYQDDIYLRGLTEINYDMMIYPHTALLGVRVKAVSQLSGSVPTITSVIKGIKVAVPKGYNGESRYQEEDWDGTLTTSSQPQARESRGTAEAGTGRILLDNATGYIVGEKVELEGGAVHTIVAKSGNYITIDYTFTSAGQTSVIPHNKVWTDNPVWCLYDLLTNTRYGLGKHYKISPDKAGLVLANFKQMADYCDVFVKDDGTVSTWDDPGARPRFSLNIVIDQYKSAREWLDIICASMRATLFYGNGMLWLDIDRPKAVTQMFTMASISNFKQTSSSYKSIPNIYEIQFNNKDKDFDPDGFTVETPELQQDYTVEEYKKNINLVGVTDERQAKALAKYALNMGTNALNTCTWTTGTQHILSQIGDVVAISHDVPKWSDSGKITSVGVPATGKVTVKLSQPVALESDNSYTLSVVRSTGTLNFSLDTMQSGTTDTVIILVPSGTPEVGEEYILYNSTTSMKMVRIVSIVPDTEGNASITAVDYNPDIFDASDNIQDVITLEKTDYSTLTPDVKVSVSNFKVEPRVYLDSTGMVKTGVDIYYTVPTGSLLWGGLVVAYGNTGVYKYTAVDKTGRVFIPDFTDSGSYTFVGMSVWQDGTQQTIEECLSDTINVPYAVVAISPSLSNLEFSSEGITGLTVIGSTGGTYLGKECRVKWDIPVMSDFTQGLVEASSSAAAYANQSLLLYYKVVVKTTGGVVRRTANVYDNYFTYTHEMNHEDGTPVRTFDITVQAVDRLGRLSAPSTLRCTNPVPSTLS